MNNITHAEVRMYKLGTGDCFVIKFFAESVEKFKMMIDAGAAFSTSAKLTPFIEDFKNYVNNHINLLVITHEHEDHVLAFEKCKNLFLQNFTVDQIWMGWTEKDGDDKIEQWKTDYGTKKRALALVANKLSKLKDDEDFKKEFLASKDSSKLLAARQRQISAIEDFAQLHVGANTSLAANPLYAGDLPGMKVVKKDIATQNNLDIKYCTPGEILDDVVDGIRFYVLGPPTLYQNVELEKGAAGESYQHNSELNQSNSFAAAVIADQTNTPEKILPFDDVYVIEPFDKIYANQQNSSIITEYNNSPWRKIDHDWLFGAGALALRMNSLTNNLSVVLAIEFVESGRIMLFPGDAEYGSWASWHKIDWAERPNDANKHLTEELLNRTVFYKVAHHLSHNGTARRLGLQMMKHKDLAAMATLDYSVIKPNWKSTMPNKAIIEELLEKTKGRVMIMNEKNLMHGSKKLSSKIVEARKKMSPAEKTEFEASLTTTELYIQYIVKG